VNLSLGRERTWTTADGVTHDTLYDMVGDAWFDDLATRFYEGVAADPVLLPLYPEDLGPPTERLAGFLRQYWGGPTTYSDERGHPRLRMRHAPFRISLTERDAWLRCMAAALVEGALPPAAETAVMEYFLSAAQHLVNAPDQDAG